MLPTLKIKNVQGHKPWKFFLACILTTSTDHRGEMHVPSYDYSSRSEKVWDIKASYRSVSGLTGIGSSG